MKMARFLFTTVGFGALTLGLSLAGEPSKQTSGQAPSEDQAASRRPAGQAQGNQARDNREQTDGTPSKSKADSRAFEQSRLAGPTKKAMPIQRPGQDRPKQAANGHEAPGNQRVVDTHIRRTPANDLHQPGLSKTATVAKDGLMISTRGNHLGGGTTAPLPGVVRGQGPAPASIGGVAASGARSSTAAINGTGMKPKP
jgi:hypothetical protein